MTHYQILGIKPTASQDEIKNAYKKLVKKYHPDIYPGDKTFAEKKIKEINAAYDILSVPEERKLYDEELNPTTYNYTPPKYDNPDSYSNYNPNNYYSNNDYSSYYKKYSYQSRTNNSSTTSSYYTNQANNYNNTNSKTINIPLSLKIKLIVIAILIYIVILIAFALQVSSLFNGLSPDSTSSNITNSEFEDDSHYYNYNTSYNNTYNPYNSYYDTPQNYIKDYEEYYNSIDDITDIIPEEDLYEVYIQYYSNRFETFEEFKDYCYYLMFEK